MAARQGLMTCDILDFRCIIVNELVGNVVLAVLLFALLYFVIAAKLRFDPKITFFLAIPIITVFSLTITGFSILYAMATLLAGVLLALVILRLIGNK